MRFPELLHSATALCLLVLLGALGTGLPSHSHARGDRSVPRDVHVVAADHHGHGTQLVEQDERAPSMGPQLPVLPGAISAMPAATATPVRIAPTGLLRPTERAPPPDAPRAPPFAV